MSAVSGDPRILKVKEPSGLLHAGIFRVSSLTIVCGDPGQAYELIRNSWPPHPADVLSDGTYCKCCARWVDIGRGGAADDTEAALHIERLRS